MPDVRLGAGSELIVTGVEHAEFAEVQTQLSSQGVDLSPLYDPGSRVDLIRGLVANCGTSGPEDPLWVDIVDELYSEVAAVRKAIAGATLARFELGRQMGPAHLNPNWKPPELKRDVKDEGTTIKTSYTPMNRYKFLSAEALKGMARPITWQERGISPNDLAVVLPLRESLEPERGRLRVPNSTHNGYGLPAHKRVRINGKFGRGGRYF